MILKVKKLNEKAVIPTKANPGDAGLDLTAISTSQHLDRNGITVEYGTGLAFEIPEGHVGLIFPRSSIHKTSLSLTNAVGVIDSGYRGEVKFKFRDLSNNIGKVYQIGDRVGQLVIIPIPEVEVVISEELSDTQRGSGAFGSTGS